MKFMDTLKKTGKSVEDALTPAFHQGSKAKPGDMDILDKLKKEHEDVATLLKQLVETKTAAVRKSLLRKIKMALVPHVRAEEKIVYNAIIALKETDPKVDGEEGYCEHSLADKMMNDLGKIPNAASPEFTAAAKVLKEIVEHHVEEEERNVWNDIRHHYNDEERMIMNRKFEAAKKKVRVA